MDGDEGLRPQGSSGSEAGVSQPPVRTTTSTYDPASGDVVKMAATENGAAVHAVTKQLDMLGRLVRYDDGNGAVTTTRYDAHGKPLVVSDSLGTYTRFTYDRAKEPRGFVTSVEDSVAGTISATYGPDGQLVRQEMPGSVSLRIGYDPAGVATSRTYTVPDGPDADTDPDVVDSSSIVENGAGQWISHRTTATAERYTYDALGRLTDVQEVVQAVAPVCTWRRYTWNDRAGRESMATSRAAGETCVDPAASASTETTRYSYDTADLRPVRRARRRSGPAPAAPTAHRATGRA
jgi:YD repeat-containing protein